MPLVEHECAKPRVHRSAYVAPTAIISGDVSIGENCAVLFGAVLTAEGGPVRIGNNCIIMENAVIRGTKHHPAVLGNNIIVGPHAYLTGCRVSDNVFLATGSTIFNGAKLGARVEVRINGTVHINTTLKPGTLVPIGWVAVGNPAKILPPREHQKIWSILKSLNFPQTVWGLERRRRKGDTLMPKITSRYTKALARHRDDRIIEE
jgi:carbonic anhydrase/acetyltransferase-like protein (isoleucine patch superfamily)